MSISNQDPPPIRKFLNKEPPLFGRFLNQDPPPIFLGKGGNSPRREVKMNCTKTHRNTGRCVCQNLLITAFFTGPRIPRNLSSLEHHVTTRQALLYSRRENLHTLHTLRGACVLSSARTDVRAHIRAYTYSLSSR
jgi:hypothetical protein